MIDIDRKHADLHWVDANGQGSMDMSRDSLREALNALLFDLGARTDHLAGILAGSFVSCGETVATVNEVHKQIEKESADDVRRLVEKHHRVDLR